MKSKLIALAFAGFVGTASATISLQTQFGVFSYDSSPVADGTLWALVVDANNDSQFFGGFGLNSSLGLAGATSSGLLSSNIALGTSLGGDTVFALGGFNGFANNGIAGLTADVLELTLGTNGLTAGRAFAFYYFPGVEFTNDAATYAVLGAAGGIHAGADPDAGLPDAMFIPADGNAVTLGAANSDLGGTLLSDSNFASVGQIVPEPSAALLSALGALGLLRRRRI